jgi:hypothetical protein
LHQARRFTPAAFSLARVFLAGAGDCAVRINANAIKHHQLGGVVRLRRPYPGSILRQNVNLAELFLNLLDTLGAERVRMTVIPARYGPPAILAGYDRNGKGRRAVAKRPQLFRKNPNQISARNLSFSHAPTPRCFRGE